MPDDNQDTVMEREFAGSLVVCIGNELVADDAVGYEVYHELQRMALPEDTRLEYTGVGGLALLDLLTGSESALIVVDAVQFGSQPGTIHELSWEDVPSCGNSAISAHGVGLRETIEVGKLLCPEKLPTDIRLIGIEGRCFNRMRDKMTPATAAAIGDAAQCIKKQLLSIHQGVCDENKGVIVVSRCN
jgi:hydrogenase maturation protease